MDLHTGILIGGGVATALAVLVAAFVVLRKDSREMKAREAERNEEVCIQTVRVKAHQHNVTVREETRTPYQGLPTADVEDADIEHGEFQALLESYVESSRVEAAFRRQKHVK